MINATIIEITAEAECDRSHSVAPQYFNIYTNDIYPKWDDDRIIFSTVDDLEVIVSANYLQCGEKFNLDSIQVFVNQGDKVAVMNNRKNKPTVSKSDILSNVLKEGNHRFVYGSGNDKDRSLTIAISKGGFYEVE